MVFQRIQLEAHGDVVVIRLNSPATKNAMTVKMLAELGEALDELGKSARVLVLAGAGGAFCSGASLDPADPLLEIPAVPEEMDAGKVLETHVNPIMTKLRGFKLPWISAVAGAAAGVGASLALAADLVVAGESAFFLQAFSRIGLVPDGGATYLLARNLGRVRAMELMLLADRLPAQKALEWGLVNAVVPDDELENRALAMAETLAKGPAMAYSMIRQAVWAAQDDTWERVIQREREMQLAAGRTHDFREGVLAFQQKRKPEFKGQ